MMLYWLVQLVKRGGISWGEGLRIYREKEVPSVAKKKISELSKPSITWGRKNGGGGGGGVCRLCFDSPHPLIFVLQDASGLMGGIKTKSTATPPPPNHFSPPGHAWLTLSSIFIFLHLGACLQAREKGKQIHPSLVQGCHSEAGAKDFPRLLCMWPPATVIGKEKKNRTK